MTSQELNKYVAQKFAEGMSDKNIAGSLGMTVECMYRKMAKDDEPKGKDYVVLKDVKPAGPHANRGAYVGEFDTYEEAEKFVRESNDSGYTIMGPKKKEKGE